MSRILTVGIQLSDRLSELGFRGGISGGLMARTMMLEEISVILAHTPESATAAEIESAVIEENILGKPTLSSRRKSISILRELYGLESGRALFRNLRRLSAIDPPSVPLLALVCVYCRDPQLRASFALIRSLKLGECLSRERMEEFIESAYPERFSSAFKKSLAQNINASWTSAGHLQGKVKKVRSLPKPRPVSVAYAMLAGYLSGLRGHRLLQSDFAELTTAEPNLIPSQLALASARGLLRFKHAGGVIEMDFSPLLTVHELTLANVTD